MSRAARLVDSVHCLMSAAEACQEELPRDSRGRLPAHVQNLIECAEELARDACSAVGYGDVNEALEFFGYEAYYPRPRRSRKRQS